MTAEELRERRQQLGVSQPQLAQALGKTKRMISLWETGRYPVPQAIALAIRHLLVEQMSEVRQ